MSRGKKRIKAEKQLRLSPVAWCDTHLSITTHTHTHEHSSICDQRIYSTTADNEWVGRRPTISCQQEKQKEKKSSSHYHFSSDEGGSVRIVLVLHRPRWDNDGAVGELLPCAADDKVSRPRRPDGSVARPPHRGVVIRPLHQLVTVEHPVVFRNPKSRERSPARGGG